MQNINVRPGETITDVVLNSIGSVLSWESVLSFNGLADWTPDLAALKNITISDAQKDNNALLQLGSYPAVNASTPDLYVKILTIETILSENTIVNNEVPETVIEQPKNLYTISQGETIADVVLNISGLASNWENILSLNNFSDWNPTLISGQNLIKTSKIDQNVVRQLAVYAACNALIEEGKITDIETLLSSNGIVNSEDLPTYASKTESKYIPKPGETITDITLNLLGSVVFWENILKQNEAIEWTPNLGSVSIPVETVDQNTKRQLTFYPAVNQSLPDVYSKIDDLNTILADNWILKTGYWNDNAIWMDPKNWIG